MNERADITFDLICFTSFSFGFISYFYVFKGLYLSNYLIYSLNPNIEIITPITVTTKTKFITSSINFIISLNLLLCYLITGYLIIIYLRL